MAPDGSWLASTPQPHSRDDAAVCIWNPHTGRLDHAAAGLSRGGRSGYRPGRILARRRRLARWGRDGPRGGHPDRRAADGTTGPPGRHLRAGRRTRWKLARLGRRPRPVGPPAGTGRPGGRGGEIRIWDLSTKGARLRPCRPFRPDHDTGGRAGLDRGPPPAAVRATASARCVSRIRPPASCATSFGGTPGTGVGVGRGAGRKLARISERGPDGRRGARLEPGHRAKARHAGQAPPRGSRP